MKYTIEEIKTYLEWLKSDDITLLDTAILCLTEQNMKRAKEWAQPLD